MAAVLLSRSFCNFFFPVLHLKYSLSSEPKLKDRQFESTDVSPVLVREEREGERENLENDVFSVSFCLFFLLIHSLCTVCFAAEQIRKNLYVFLS